MSQLQPSFDAVRFSPCVSYILASLLTLLWNQLSLIGRFITSYLELLQGRIMAGEDLERICCNSFFLFSRDLRLRDEMKGIDWKHDGLRVVAVMYRRVSRPWPTSEAKMEERMEMFRGLRLCSNR